jgi:hypothetical protein
VTFRWPFIWLLRHYWSIGPAFVSEVIHDECPQLNAYSLKNDSVVDLATGVCLAQGCAKFVHRYSSSLTGRTNRSHTDSDYSEQATDERWFDSRDVNRYVCTASYTVTRGRDAWWTHGTLSPRVARLVSWSNGVPRGVVWGVQIPPEISKFWQSWAECPVPWKTHP